MNGIFLSKFSVFVYMSPSSNFDFHVNVTKGKAIEVLGFIKPNTKMFNLRPYALVCLTTLYFALVRPILIFGGTVVRSYLLDEKMY